MNDLESFTFLCSKDLTDLSDVAVSRKELDYANQMIAKCPISVLFLDLIYLLYHMVSTDDGLSNGNHKYKLNED